MTWTCVFYIFVFILAVAPMLLIWQYWHEARTRDWIWISQDSRTMYVDGAKTLITASGIAVALVASVLAASARNRDYVVTSSAKTAVVCLICCICLSLIVILALLRGFERAQSRNIDEQRKAGKPVEVGEGKLTPTELLCILLPAAFALSCFLIGFVFLGRIAFHS